MAEGVERIKQDSMRRRGAWGLAQGLERLVDDDSMSSMQFAFRLFSNNFFMITNAVSVYYLTNRKNAPKLQKRKNSYKLSVPFPHICVHLKKLSPYHAFHPLTSFLPPTIVRKGLLFLTAH